MLWGEGRGEGLCCSPSPHPLPRTDAFPEVSVDRGGEGARHSSTDRRLRRAHVPQSMSVALPAFGDTR